MTAATFTFGVTDLALEKVHVVEAKANPHFPRRVGEWLVKLLGGFLAGVLEKKAHDFAELAVWFSGAVVTLEHERVNAHVDLNDRLVPALEQVEQHLLDMRAQILKVCGEMSEGGHHGRVISALRALARASADLHEAILHFKWAVMENDADVDVSHGNFEVFDSPDALFESLKH